MQVQSLGWEDSPGEGHGNPLQYPCLENPRDREAWWARVHMVSKTRTKPKRLSTRTAHTPGGSTVKSPPANVGDTRDVGSIPGSERSPGEEITATHSRILPRESHGQRNLTS